MRNPIEKYKNIINLPHHVSKKHPQMSLYERSAQFAPFSALTGYEDIIREEGRLTDNQIEINEEKRAILDYKLNSLIKRIDEKPNVYITYFVPDELKSGGKYITVNVQIKKIDLLEHVILAEDGTYIPASNIIDMQSDIFAE